MRFLGFLAVWVCLLVGIATAQNECARVFRYKVAQLNLNNNQVSTVDHHYYLVVGKRLVYTLEYSGGSSGLAPTGPIVVDIQAGEPVARMYNPQDVHQVVLEIPESRGQSDPMARYFTGVLTAQPEISQVGGQTVYTYTYQQLGAQVLIRKVVDPSVTFVGLPFSQFAGPGLLFQGGYPIEVKVTDNAGSIVYHMEMQGDVGTECAYPTPPAHFRVVNEQQFQQLLNEIARQPAPQR